MSEDDGLRKKVDRLAAAPSEIVDGWRRLDDPLAVAITSEIDETVLPRKLSFRSDGGSVLVVEAGHRRLRRFLPPCPEALMPWGHLFEAPRLDAGADLGAAGAVLARHFGEDAQAWVKSEPLPSGSGGGQTGLSAAGLREAWSAAGDKLSGDTLDPAEAVDEFLDGVARRASQWVVLGDGVVEAQSDGAEALGSEAPSAWASVQGTSGATVPLCVILGRPDGGSLVLAGDAERAIVAQVPSGDASDLAGLWQSLLG